MSAETVLEEAAVEAAPTFEQMVVSLFEDLIGHLGNQSAHVKKLDDLKAAAPQK